jgi:hypothetical protein
MRLVVEQATMTGIPVYTCSMCGARGHGSKVTLARNGMSCDPGHVGALFEQAQHYVANDHIPVGWGSFGRDDTRCHVCALKGGAAP